MSYHMGSNGGMAAVRYITPPPRLFMSPLEMTAQYGCHLPLTELASLAAGPMVMMAGNLHQ